MRVYAYKGEKKKRKEKMVVGMCPGVQVMRERGDDVRSCGGKNLLLRLRIYCKLIYEDL